jgi:hypothetical protein
MTDEELKALFEAMRRENAEAHDTTRGRFEASVEAVRGEHEVTRRHFDVTFEAAKHEIRLVAESVSHLSEKLAVCDVALWIVVGASGAVALE